MSTLYGCIEPPEMKITGRPTAPANAPETAPTKAPNLPPHTDLLPCRLSHRPRRRRIRLRGGGTPTGKQSSRPQTPLLKWKTEERERNAISIDDDEYEVSPPEGRRRHHRREKPISTRKLASVLWRLNLPDSVAPGRGSGGLPRRSGEEVLLGGRMMSILPFKIHT